VLVTSSATPAASGWRDSAVTRVLGSALGWFVFTLCFTLLFQVSITVLALGGYCASGGPYEIAVECPAAVAGFAPLSIFGGLAGVGISLGLAQGFGTPLLSLAWPILFVGLGGAFLASFFVGGSITGLVIGIMFVVMGLAPLVLELRASPQRVIIGRRTADGREFIEEGAGRSIISLRGANPDGSVRPNPGHWLLPIAVTLLSAGLGVFTALAWFRAAS
jgi:hypothetical protein